MNKGVLYLVSSDLTLTYEQITTIYHKRWKVEECHKTLKHHVSFCKFPTKTVRTQSNHIFASIYSFFKLEYLSLKSELNPTALRAKLYLTANRAAFNQIKNHPLESLQRKQLPQQLQNFMQDIPVNKLKQFEQIMLEVKNEMLKV